MILYSMHCETLWVLLDEYYGILSCIGVTFDKLNAKFGASLSSSFLELMVGNHLT